MANLSECYCENGLGITKAYQLVHPETSSFAPMVVQALAQQEYEHKQSELERLNRVNSGAPINGILVCDIVDPLRFIHVGADFRPQILLLGHDTIPEQARPFRCISKDLIPLISDKHKHRAGVLLGMAGTMLTQEEHEVLSNIQRTGSLFPLLQEGLVDNLLKFHPLCGNCPLLRTGKCIPKISYMTDLGMISSMAWGSMDIERRLVN